MREAELKLTAKLQPPEGVTAFCRLILVGELLQLKVRHMKSPDIDLSVKVWHGLFLTVTMSVLQPLNPRKWLANSTQWEWPKLLRFTDRGQC